MIDSRERTALGDGTTVVEVVMHKAERAQFGHLLFLVCDPAGAPITAWKTQSMPLADEWVERGRMMVDVVRGKARPEHRPTAQFQLFSDGFASFEPARR